MEKRTKMSRNQKEGFAKRSPHQSLKGFQVPKPKTSNLSSSSSTSVSFEAPNGRSRSSSSSTTHPQRKPKTLPTTSNNAPPKSSAAASKLRSKENEVPKMPTSQRSTKALQLGVDKKQCGKANRKPTIRNGQRSKLCSVQANPARNSEGKSKKFEENGSGKIPTIKLFVESNRTNSNYTPGGKTFTVCDLDSVSPDYSKRVETDQVSKTANEDTAVKTPPVEVSVSPEIQYGSHFKMSVMKSAATPICYGAGHLLSGVTDKRKCRRRGSLKGACEKINLFHHENARDSLVPLPAEASIRWVSSPSNELSENRSDQCGNTNKEVEEDLLFISPNYVSECIENNSAVSLGSLSSGHIVQTASSDSSSYGGILGGLKADVVQFELDSISETLNKVGSLPSCVSLKCADSIGLSQVEENGDSLCSWVSESTVENFALSQTRISWKDGVLSEIAENNELDCFQCWSDEEIDDDMDCGRDGENVLALNNCLNISAKGITNESAESICTNGGNLVASGDSDRMYCPENR